MGQREYIISIDFEEQYRTTNRGQAKAFYRMVDETFDREVDGLTKRLIQLEPDGWNGKVLFQDVIRCPKKTFDEEKEEDTAKPDFRVIVAGSRDFDDYDLLREKCDALLARKTDKNIIIVSGTARVPTSSERGTPVSVGTRLNGTLPIGRMTARQPAPSATRRWQTMPMH